MRVAQHRRPAAGNRSPRDVHAIFAHPGLRCSWSPLREAGYGPTGIGRCVPSAGSLPEERGVERDSRNAPLDLSPNPVGTRTVRPEIDAAP